MTTFIDPDIVAPEVYVARVSLPKFPDGRIDYTDAAHAPVLNVLVLCDGYILLTHRGDKVGTMRNCWHIPAGYLDEEVSLRHKALEELREELGISASMAKDMRALAPSKETLDGKTWTVYSIIVRVLERPPIVLDWEHDDARWVSLTALAEYNLLPSLLRVIEKLR